MQSKTYNNYCAIYTPEIQRLAIYNPFGIPNRVVDCFESYFEVDVISRNNIMIELFIDLHSDTLFNTSLPTIFHYLGELDCYIGKSLFNTHNIIKYNHLPNNGDLDTFIAPHIDYVYQALHNCFNGVKLVDSYGNWTKRVIFINQLNGNKAGLDSSVKGQVLINCGEGYQEFANVNGAMAYIERFWSK